MAGDYKKLLNKKKKKVFADPKTMGVNIDKNEYYEIILSNSAHPENIKQLLTFNLVQGKLVERCGTHLDSAKNPNMGMWYSAE